MGPSGVGKTTFITRHTTGKFLTTHEHTKTTTHYVRTFYTNHGRMTFNVWDTPCTVQYSTCSGIIYMIDFSWLSSEHKIQVIKNKLKCLPLTIPIVVCINKRDIATKVELTKLSKFRDYIDRLNVVYNDNINICLTSSKTNYNFVEPFVILANAITGYGNTILVEEPEENEFEDLGFDYERFSI